MAERRPAREPAGLSGKDQTVRMHLHPLNIDMQVADWERGPCGTGVLQREPLISNFAYLGCTGLPPDAESSAGCISPLLPFNPDMVIPAFRR